MKVYKNILQNRKEASKLLLDVIPMLRVKEEDWDIIAVSKGGLELAEMLRGKLKNNIDFLFSESILAPHNCECEVARVSESEEIVIHEELVSAFEIQYDYIYGEARRKHEENILSYIYQYRKGRHFLDVKDRVILLIDDGSDTGMKFMLALKTILAQKPKAVYIAVPVLPTDVLELLEPYADDIFYLYDIEDYVNSAQYYKELNEVSDETIEKILEEKR
jgi:putative phosphoribosyl transferase